MIFKKIKRNKISKLLLTVSLVSTIVISSCLTAFAGVSSTTGNSHYSGGGGSSGGSDIGFKMGDGVSAGIDWDLHSGKMNLNFNVPLPFGTEKSDYKLDSITNNNTTEWCNIIKYKYNSHIYDKNPKTYINPGNKNKIGYYNFTWNWWYEAARLPNPSSIIKDKDTFGYYFLNNIWVNGYKIPSSNLQNEASRLGYKYNSSLGLYTNGNKKLDVVWVEKTTKTVTEYVDTIVYVKNGGSILKDNRNKTAEWLFKNKVNEVNYTGKSAAHETNYRRTVQATVYKVQRKVKKTYNGSGKVIKSTVVAGSYKIVGGAKHYTKDITYKVYSPAVTSKQFMPFNLNRNGVATREDISGPYPTLVANKNLDMSVNNHQNITDNRALQTLDTNNGLKFTVRFNNNQFGIPTKSEGGIDIASEAPCRDYKNANGTYDSEVFNILGSNGQTKTGVFNYTGGRAQNINAQVSNDGYWNLSMKADVSSNNASLTYNGTERVGGNVLSLLTGNRGGDFIFKTTKTGTYNLCGTSASNKWWEARYEGGKFYRYGIQYKGKITTSGIGNPSVVDKNFYTKLSTTTINQPILTGTFEAKTVAGYIE